LHDAGDIITCSYHLKFMDCGDETDNCSLQNVILLLSKISWEGKKHTGRSLEYTLKLGNVDAKVTYRGKLL